MPAATVTTPRLTCGGCSSTWTGVSRAHCSGCHVTFSGATLFDKHIVRGKHLDPAGMVIGGYRLAVIGGVWCSTAPNLFRAARS